MKRLGVYPLVLALICGCSSTKPRNAEQSAAYASMSDSEKQLVDRGRVERGMDTNAVYLAWGKPSQVVRDQSDSGGDQIWLYYGNRPVLTPAWRYVPGPYGYGRMDYLPEHHSEGYLKAEVHFHNGRVSEWKEN